MYRKQYLNYLNPHMNNPFLTFQTFSDPSLADEMAEKLTNCDIEVKIEKSAQLLDSVFIGVSSSPDLCIKILSSDFVRAHQCLEDYYKKEVDTADPAYYLFSFTDEELLEIINRPDEWGPYDYQLAKKIMQEKGKEIGPLTTSRFSLQRLEELSKPASGSGLITVSSIFIVYILISSLFMYINQSFNFPYSIFLVLLAGSHLAYGKRTLPDGRQVLLFDEKDRKSGKVISIIGTVLLVWTFFMIVLVTSEYSFDIFDFSF